MQKMDEGTIYRFPDDSIRRGGTWMTDFGETLLRSADERAKCEWCRHPDASVHRNGLCSHCGRIKTEVDRLRKASERPAANEGETFERDFNRRIAEQKMALAQNEGRYYDGYAERNVDGINIEHQLRFIAKLLVGREMFVNYAGIFETAFPQRERRLLFYFLSLIEREYQRKNRRGYATARVMDGEVSEGGSESRAAGSAPADPPSAGEGSASSS